MNQLALFASPNLPALLTTAEAQTQTRFWEFFAAQIRNKHTRRAYAQATREFFRPQAPHPRPYQKTS